MVAKILGAQRDFSYGEIDVALKRADDHPARKAGLRQMANARILNSGAVQNRSGRRALYPVTNAGPRTERFTIAAGKVFDIQFAAGRLKIIDNTGTTVGNFTLQGNGAALPWTANNLNNVDFAILGLKIYITFSGMRPQVITFDGVSTWSIADYVELVIGSQKRTAFYRISPQGISITPNGLTGNVTVIASSAVFNPLLLGTRIRFVGRQMLVIGYTSPTSILCTVQESLPGGQQIQFSGSSPNTIFSVGDVIQGSVSGSRGIITAFSGGGTTINVQLLSLNSSVTTSGTKDNTSSLTTAFTTADSVVGPAGSLVPSTVGAIGNPFGCTVWDDEVMNDFRGYPASCFVDQFRVGFCNFPSVPGGISWSAINSPTDLYVGPNPSDAMFEITPRKAQIYFVVPGQEGSEFVFTDKGIFYIPISPTNPLKSGSVQFLLLSGDGAAQVKPRVAQEVILYVNSGQNAVMAVIATGAYQRPFNTKNLSLLHSHLFSGIQCIAAPSGDGTFIERYVYVLNGSGSIAVGKYDQFSLQGNQPLIGWGPWSGGGTVTWIAANGTDLIFTTSYFGTPMVEILDDTQYLDGAVLVNSLPAAFTPPVGKGPLFLIAPSQTVTLMDQSTRAMGTYAIDINGFIVPQFNGGENLAIASLVAGQPWTMTIEPFVADAAPGQDVGQRMFKRRVARFAVYVVNSTGFLMARLFSGPLTRMSPALGTVMNQRRVTAWNVDDDPTKPPPLREEAQRWRPLGRAFDPRVAIIKDTPGSLLISEIGIEATL